MEFLKKNYMKMIIATITLVGAIFFIALLAQYDASYHNFAGNPNLLVAGAEDAKNANSFLIGYITALIFFLSLTAIIILSMFENIKKYTKWITLSLGVVCTILITVAIVLAIGSESSEYARAVMGGDFDTLIRYGMTLQGETEAAINNAIQSAHDTASYQYFSRVVELVTQLVIFGLLPLTFGIKKVLPKK